MRRWICLLLIAAGVLQILLFPIPSSAQTPAPAGPLTVEGDTVIYDEARREVEATGSVRLRYRGVELRAGYVRFDLATEVMTARDGVVLVDAAGRELRGQSLTYDVRLGIADLRQGETVIDGFYVRSARIQASERRVVATEAMATTCDPARPAYRIEAAEIEVIPGDRLVARRASVWLGSIRILTLPTLTVSLREGGEGVARSLPQLGYNSVDGIWIDYLYGYQLAGLQGGLYLKYGMMTRFIARNMLRYERSGYAAELTVGRNQDVEMRIFDQAEVAVTTPRFQAGSVQMRVWAGTGWFEEQITGLRSTRTYVEAAVNVPSTRLGISTFSAGYTYRHAWYGIGAVQGVVRGGAALTRPFSPRTSLTVAHTIVEVANGTPFLFDHVLVRDRVNDLSAVVNRSGIRLGAREVQLYGGGAYSLRNGTRSVLAGIIAPDPRGLSVSLGLRYNLDLAELTTTLDTGVQLSPSTRFAVFAEYNARTQTFTEFDYTLRARLCDCFEVSVRYRQVRRELWIQFGLSPEASVQLLPR